MASVYLNESTGLHVVAWLYKGKRHYKSHPTLEKATEFKTFIESDLLVAKTRNIEPAFIAETKSRDLAQVVNPTLDQFWKQYEAETSLAYQTIKGYEAAWDSLTVTLPVKRIDDIEPKHLIAWRKALEAEDYALPSINSYLRRLRVMFNWCVTHKLIRSNPAKTLKFARADRYDPKPYLTKPEIEQILFACLSLGGHEGPFLQENGKLLLSENFLFSEGAILLPPKTDMYFFCLLGIYAGLRVNEILNARWEWIRPPREFDSGGGSITVQSGKNFRVKARQARTIPLHTRLAPILWKIKTIEPKGYIIKRDITEWKTNSYRWNWRKSLTKTLATAELETVNRYGEDQNVTPHTFRHTFCSLLAQSGYTAYEIQKYAGHSDLKVSESYMHLAPNENGLDW
ncbi:MAG: tyrosine-type recombinase/integrase [Candidatus Hydrogenedentes bacterium]|nr:tyrosine-type recombinase/integrase [Candidatus Hydrogenedentota bacterium]